MVRKLVGAMIVAGAVAFSASAAQAQMPIHFGIGGGATVPIGDFKDAVNTGFNVQGSLGFGVPMVPLGLRLDVTYDRFGVKNAGGNLGVLGGQLNALYTLMPTPMVSPYITGGVGVYNAKYSSSDGFPADFNTSQTKFGWNAGAGLSFHLAGFSTFVEARYRSIMTEGQSSNMIPITVGVMF
jgi:opacity protein-like surface antigen